MVTDGDAPRRKRHEPSEQSCALPLKLTQPFSVPGAPLPIGWRFHPRPRRADAGAGTSGIGTRPLTLERPRAAEVEVDRIPVFLAKPSGGPGGAAGPLVVLRRSGVRQAGA